MVTVAYRYILLAHIHITTHIRYEKKIEEKRPALVKNSEGKKRKTKKDPIKTLILFGQDFPLTRKISKILSNEISGRE